MIRYVLAAAILLAPVVAKAQQAGPVHSPAANHDMSRATGTEPRAARPTQAGQGAFAAIQEIVSILEANPDTDWSSVDIEALRRHLVDMSNVTLHSVAVASPVANGFRYTVTGAGPVRDSIRRMAKAHAATMNGRDGWRFAVQDHPEGAILTVTVSNRRTSPN